MTRRSQFLFLSGGALLTGAGIKPTGVSRILQHPDFECPPPKICHPTPTPRPPTVVTEPIYNLNNNAYGRYPNGANVAHGDTNGSIYNGTSVAALQSNGSYVHSHNLTTVAAGSLVFTTYTPPSGWQYGQTYTYPAPNTYNGITVAVGQPSTVTNGVTITWETADRSASCSLVIQSSGSNQLRFDFYNSKTQTTQTTYAVIPAWVLPQLYHAHEASGIRYQKICCRCLAMNSHISYAFAGAMAVTAAFFFWAPPVAALYAGAAGGYTIVGAAFGAYGTWHGC